MNWHRIGAILKHSYFHATHSRETWIDLGWFTFVELLLFGFMSTLFANADANSRPFLLIGYLCWEVVRIGQYSITISLLWEVWSKSLSVLFISPLTISEYVMGQIISSFLKTVGIMIAAAALTYWFFGFSVLSLGGWAIIYLILLMLFSFSTGIFVMALLFRFGTDIQSLGWALIFAFQPISAIFYPLSSLPDFIKPLAYLSPITYVAESARSQVATGQPIIHYLYWSALVNVIYFIGSYWLLKVMYRWSRKTGAFARLGY